MEKGGKSTVTSVTDGEASFSVALLNLVAGTYKRMITELVGTKKMDQETCDSR